MLGGLINGFIILSCEDIKYLKGMKFHYQAFHFEPRNNSNFKLETRNLIHGQELSDRTHTHSSIIDGVFLLVFASTPAQASKAPSAPSEMGAQDSTQGTTVVSDSVLSATYGDLSASMKGQESPIVIENEDLRLVFSNKGGPFAKLS